MRDFVALLRWRASSLLRMRLTCCLMFATESSNLVRRCLDVGARARSPNHLVATRVARPDTGGPRRGSWDDGGEEPAHPRVEDHVDPDHPAVRDDTRTAGHEGLRGRDVHPARADP